MKQRTVTTYAAWTLFAEAVGVLSGLLTREGIRAFNEGVLQPPLSPPAIVFPIVWTLLFALMGIGAARVYLAPPSEDRRRSLRLFFAQLTCNVLWSVVFFNLQAYGATLLVLAMLWVLILGMILAYRSVDAFAAWSQAPYLLWVTFAAYLNFGVWRLNG